MTTDPSAIQVTTGPSFTGKMSGRPAVGTEGDYVVVTTGGDAYTNAGPGTYVTRVSTGEFWFIPAPPKTFVRLAAISNKEIIVTESAMSGSTADFQNYIRYDLTQLKALSQGIVP